MSVDRQDGKTNVTSLIYMFGQKFDPDGSIRRTKAEELGITESELQEQWDSKSLRARQRGNACSNYFTAAAQKQAGLEGKYLGSSLPEFAQMEKFLGEYKVVECDRSISSLGVWTEIEVRNDCAFGRVDAVVQHKKTGEKYAVEIKTGELGNYSYQNFAAPFDHFPSSKRDIALIQAAMMAIMTPGTEKGLVVHFCPELYDVIEVEPKYFEIAEAMFEYKRELMKKDGVYNGK